jgi:hypothetical protein
VFTSASLLLAAESDFVMLIRTLETKLRYQTWKSADVRLLLSRLVQVLCVLLANERALLSLRRVCKEKKKAKGGDVIVPVLCACICLLLGSPESSAQLQGVKLLGNAAALAYKCYRSFGVLDALLEPLHVCPRPYCVECLMMSTHRTAQQSTYTMQERCCCSRLQTLSEGRHCLMMRLRSDISIPWLMCNGRAVWSCQSTGRRTRASRTRGPREESVATLLPLLPNTHRQEREVHPAPVAHFFMLRCV